MTFYTISFVGLVDDQGRPVTTPKDGKQTVRELPFWDDRTIDEMKANYAAEGSLTLHRLGTRHAPGRPLEHKGEMVIFAPHMISLQVDLKAALKQPDGPLEFLPPTPRADAE